MLICHLQNPVSFFAAEIKAFLGMPLQSLHTQLFDAMAEEGRGLGASGVNARYGERSPRMSGSRFCAGFVHFYHRLIGDAPFENVNDDEGGDIDTAVIHPPYELIAADVIR